MSAMDLLFGFVMLAAQPPGALEIKGIYPGSTRADVARVFPAAACVPHKGGPSDTACVVRGVPGATFAGAQVGIIIMLTDGVVVSVIISEIDGADSDIVVRALLSKFGACTRRGETRGDEVCGWERGGRTLIYQRGLLTQSRTTVMLTTPEQMKAEREFQDATRREDM